jgi:hypothetical protein
MRTWWMMTFGVYICLCLYIDVYVLIWMPEYDIYECMKDLE